MEIAGSATTGNVVEGNKIGTDVNGTTAFDSSGRPLGNTVDGVRIDTGASDNTVGGSTAGSRNIISGNMGDGVDITDNGTSDNVVAGDFIGLDFTGTTAVGTRATLLGNGRDGVAINSGPAVT